MRRRLRTIRLTAAVSAMCVLLAGTAAAQIDPASDDASHWDDHSPRGALWRAAAVPGWGQAYNRQYYKLPVVYGGLAGLVYLAVTRHQLYHLYREAYWYADPRLWTADGPLYPEFQSSYNDFLTRIGRPPEHQMTDAEAAEQRQRIAGPLRTSRDAARRNRDLLIIGTGIFYTLTILDAYVSAHILDFDLGDDLALNLRPSPIGVHAGLTWQF